MAETRTLRSFAHRTRRFVIGYQLCLSSIRTAGISSVWPGAQQDCREGEFEMRCTRPTVVAFLAASLPLARFAAAQKVTRKAPTAQDWAAIAKLPDFNGVWEMVFGGGAARGGGRSARVAGPPLTPAYAAKAQAERAQPAREAETANCLPPGLPAIMGQPYPMEFLLTPGQVTIVIEAYTQVRHIYTDGRPLPEDPDPTFYGTSVGVWEGDTLVTQTVGLEHVARGLSFPYSDKLRVVEHFRLTDPDTMTIETTVIDPEALAMPYSMGTRTLKRHRNWTIAEYICEENNRNFVDAQGKAGIHLANPEASPK